MNQLKWEYILTLFFVSCSLLVLILIIWQGDHRESYRVTILQEIDNVKSSGFTLQELPSAKITQQAITDYHEMIERPLFFTGRVPFIPSDEQVDEREEEVIEPPDKITMLLIGVINTPDHAYALFHNPKAKADEPKFQRLKQDEKINGWLIKEIKQDRVIISADENLDEILLAKPRVHKKTRPKRKKSKKTRKPNPFKQKTKK